MSLLSQRPLKVNLAGWEERLSFDLGFDVTTDCTWANRMIWIVAEIVAFCFGDRNSSDWEDSRAKVERWHASRPKSFDPILYIERDPQAKRYFPEIRLGHPWHGELCWHLGGSFARRGRNGGLQTDYARQSRGSSTTTSLSSSLPCTIPTFLGSGSALSVFAGPSRRRCYGMLRLSVGSRLLRRSSRPG